MATNEQRGKCTNFGNCTKADTGEIVNIQDKDKIYPVCPECNESLVVIVANKNTKTLVLSFCTILLLILIISPFWKNDDQTHTVTITNNSNKQNIVISSDDEKALNCGSSCKHEYPKGAKLKLHAQPGTGFRFDSWDGDCAQFKDSECALSIDSDKKITATFIEFSELFTLTINPPDITQGKVISRLGEMDCGADCSRQYSKNTEIRIEANPEQGFEFQSWTGECASFETNKCTLTMDNNKNLGVVFRPSTANSTIKILVSGEGVVATENNDIHCDVDEEASVCKKEYPKNTELVLTATPKNGYHLRLWGEPCEQAENNKCSVKLDTNKELIAIFEKDETENKSGGVPLDTLRRVGKVLDECKKDVTKNCSDLIQQAISGVTR